MSRTKIDISACIDLGSSYFRLLHAEIAESERGVEINPLFEEARYIGWGDEIEKTRIVSQDRMRIAAELLNELIDISIHAGCAKPVLVGTNVFRKADNSDELLSYLQKSVSLRIHILSEMGEAALGFLGTSSILDSEEEALLIDIGGTSTEVAWGKGGSFDDYIEIPFGTHRVALIQRAGPGMLGGRFLKRNFLNSPEPLGSVGDLLNSRLSSLPFGAENFKIVATGGTAVSSALILRFMKRMPNVVANDTIITEELLLMARRMDRLSLRELYRFLPVTEQRARLLIPGLHLLTSIISSLGVSKIRVTPRDLRWGVLISGGKFEGGYLFNE